MKTFARARRQQSWLPIGSSLRDWIGGRRSLHSKSASNLLKSFRKCWAGNIVATSCLVEGKRSRSEFTKQYCQFPSLLLFSYTSYCMTRPLTMGYPLSASLPRWIHESSFHRAQKPELHNSNTLAKIRLSIIAIIEHNSQFHHGSVKLIHEILSSPVPARHFLQGALQPQIHKLVVEHYQIQLHPYQEY